MKCPNCGAENADSARFCNLCHEKLRESSKVRRAGFCQLCNQNVWLNEDNSCINGHTPQNVRNIYEVNPQGKASNSSHGRKKEPVPQGVPAESKKSKKGNKPLYAVVISILAALLLFSCCTVGQNEAEDIEAEPEKPYSYSDYSPVERKYYNEDGDFINPVPTAFEEQVFDDLQREYDQNPYPEEPPEPWEFASEDEWLASEDEWFEVIQKIDKECEQRVADRYGISLEELSIIRFKVVTYRS